MAVLNINGTEHQLEVDGDMPLLWAIRDIVGLTGTKFGCGQALCGACTVHLDGVPVRSCQTFVADAAGAAITTIEGLNGQVAETVQTGLGGDGRAAVRLLPVRADHVGGGAARPRRRSRPTRTSTRR